MPAPAVKDLLAASGLPGRWRGCGRFTMLALGLSAADVRAVCALWRSDPDRCARLHIVAIEPLDSSSPPRPGLRRIELDGGRVVLQRACGEPARWLPQLLLQADAFLLAAPAALNSHDWKALSRLAAPGATVSDARCGPLFVPRRAPGHPLATALPAARHAIVIGAGLAGAASAQALAAAGIRCTVLERHAAPAQEASGNAGGLFHGVINGQDGLHARFNRAAALLAQATYAPLIAAGAVPGRLDGLLRLAGTDADPAAMAALRLAQALPADYVQVLDVAAARERSGLPLREPAWLYPGGGWLAPQALVQHWLQRDGIELRCNAGVSQLQQVDGHWQALDAQGVVLADAPLLVVASAMEVKQLLGLRAEHWAMGRQRGQVTRIAAGTPGLRRLRLPVAGGGYALSLPDGDLLCGATATLQDDEPALRPADQQFNLGRLRRLGIELPGGLPLAGRVGWRTLTDDRLPIAGAVPVAGAAGQRLRDVARVPGLFVCTGLGSRGISWAPLLGALVASWAAGVPFPVETALVEAADPARFAVRRTRRPPAGP